MSTRRNGSLAQLLTIVERWAITNALEAAGGNKSAAARHLGINRYYLYVRMRRYGLPLGPRRTRTLKGRNHDAHASE